MKTCTKCGIEKKESEFYKMKCAPDGLQYSCKICGEIRKKKYRLEKYDEYRAKENEYNSTRREKNNEIAKKSRLKNYEKVLISGRISRLKRKDITKQNAIIARDNLLDSHIKACIHSNFKIPIREITPELIELKRIELTNKRLIKKLKQNETK